MKPKFINGIEISDKDQAEIFMNSAFIHIIQLLMIYLVSKMGIEEGISHTFDTDLMMARFLAVMMMHF